MSAPLSNELFFDVHRGIPAESVRGIETNRIGAHWSAREDIARDFAVDNVDPDYKKPYVVHGKMPMSTVETDTDTLARKKVGGVFAPEQEVPGKDRAPMLITGVTSYRGETRGPEKYKKSRTRRYNPPREAKI